MSIVRCEHCERFVDLDFIDQNIDEHFLCESCQDLHGREYEMKHFEEKLFKKQED